MPKVELTPLLRKVLADPSGRKQLRKALTETHRKPEIVTGGRRFRLESVQDFAPCQMPRTCTLSQAVRLAAATVATIVIFHSLEIFLILLHFTPFCVAVFIITKWGLRRIASRNAGPIQSSSSAHGGN